MLTIRGERKQKLLFGTDAGPWSVGKPPSVQFTLFESMDLPAKAKAGIYRRNAERLFGFEAEEQPAR